MDHALEYGGSLFSRRTEMKELGLAGLAERFKPSTGS
jgi:hypothetical protein